LEIRRASKTISLVLIGSMAVFFGFKSCYDADPDWASATQPSGSGGGGYHGGHYWSSGYRGGGSSRGGRSHFSGTSRGGFGASGHAASS
jgi:hypothetical protein